MPNYYNPYNFYPQTYLNQAYGMQPQMPQQSYGQQPQNQGPKMMEWVEGEVGAKAFQMPNGWPANSPIPLWDSTDTVIYLKSWGPMGIPNPMQKLRYEMPEQQNHFLGNNGEGGQSGSVNASQMSGNYATKDDLENMKKEIREMISEMKPTNNSNNQNGNRGANR